MEEGPDESGQPLRRDCYCRGKSARFGHNSFSVKYAEQKNEDWDGHDLDEFVEPWAVCPNCCQQYQNELAVGLADEFVTFVEEKYPGDQSMHLEALNRKLNVNALQIQGIALSTKNALQVQGIALSTKQADEANLIVSKMLSIIGEMKTSNPSLPV